MQSTSNAVVRLSDQGTMASSETSSLQFSQQKTNDESLRRNRGSDKVCVVPDSMHIFRTRRSTMNPLYKLNHCEHAGENPGHYDTKHKHTQICIYLNISERGVDASVHDNVCQTGDNDEERKGARKQMKTTETETLQAQECEHLEERGDCEYMYQERNHQQPPRMKTCKENTSSDSQPTVPHGFKMRRQSAKEEDEKNGLHLQYLLMLVLSSFLAMARVVLKLHPQPSIVQVITLTTILLAVHQPLLLRVQAQEQCGAVPVTYEVTWRNCQPQTVPFLACRGTCNSYVKVDQNRPDTLQRSCRCCQPLSHKRLGVLLRCPSPDDPDQVVLRQVKVMLPRNCFCRPCSGEDERND